MGEETVYSQFTDGEWRESVAVLPEEMSFQVFVNGEELATLLCTPEKLNCLVIGFLRSEGFISGMSDIVMMRICPDDSLAEVRLKRSVQFPARRTITSGCGGGITFDLAKDVPPLESGFRLTAGEVVASVRLLREGTRPGRGIHASALGNGHELLVTAEDIGRHNTLDKIWGECLLRKIPTDDTVLVTTGRISSEMIVKAANMRTPVVASLNSATKQAVSLGERLGITVCGYVRGGRMAVYSHTERVRG